MGEALDQPSSTPLTSTPASDRRPRKPRGPTWRIPMRPADRPGGKRLPEVIRVAAGVLAASLRTKHGLAWRTVCRNAIVAGYAGARAMERKNQFRADGADTLVHVMRALMEAADVRTGFVGRPPKEAGGRWTRLTLQDIAWRAIGNQTPAAVRRTKDALQVAINLGWLEPTIRVNRYDQDKHVVRGAPGVRRVNWDAICACTGTERYLESARAHALEQARKKRFKVVANQAKATPPAATAASHAGAPVAPGHARPAAPTWPPEPSHEKRQLVDAVLSKAFKDDIKSIKSKA